LIRIPSHPRSEMLEMIKAVVRVLRDMIIWINASYQQPKKMRKNPVILFLILLTNFSFGQKVEYKIYPVDESKNDTIISKFVGILEEVITEKDTFRLYNLLDENVVTSFGGAIYGKQGFIENWNLEKPDSSRVWDSMKRIIDMGGVFEIGGVSEATKDSLIFQFFYANSNKLFDKIYKKNPEYDFDPYFTVICVKDNITIYKSPDYNSVIVGNISYDVLAMDYQRTNEEITNKSADRWKWLCVTTIDKSITGWVLNGDDVYFLGGLKLIIEKVKDEYKITGFFPFD
jgi:hypothetical protein